MAIKEVLEQKFGSTFLLNPKIRLSLLCSCGTTYRVTEKFPVPQWTNDPHIFKRPTTCPNCHETSYISHEIKALPNEDYTYQIIA